MRFITIFIVAVILLANYTTLAQEAFQPKTSLINSSQQNVVLTDQFNEDQAEDLLIFQSDGSEECCIGSYKLLINDGSGNFSQEVNVATDVEEWEAVRSGDVDNDGKADIIAYSFASNSINLYLNQGASGFSTPTSLIADYPGGTFEIIDLTGDELVDIIYSADDQLQLLTNLGELNFSAPVTVANGQLIHIGDFDQDGLNELFTTDGGGDNIEWYRNNGNGTFSVQATSITNEGSFFTPDILIGDLGGDETNELVISYAAAGDEGIIAPKLYSFNESEEFVLEGNLVELEEFELSPQNVRLNDVDQDGDLDILGSFTFALAFARTESDFDQFVGWYENIGNFQFAPRLLNDALLTGTYVDLNNDQQLDILLDTSDELIWQENLGQATFSVPKYLTDSRALPTALADEAGTFISFGDLNRDSFPEMIVAEGNSNRVLRFANQDSTLVVPPQLLTLSTLIPGNAAVLSTAERTDLLLIGGDATEGQIIVRYPVEETGALGTKDTLYSGSLDATYYPGDFTGDSQPDIAFTDFSLSEEGEVFLLVSNSNGTYELVDTQIIGILEGVYDLNQDNTTDLIIDGTFYTQNAEGNFDVLLTPESPFDHIEDINGDGLADFLLFSEVEVTLFLANNDGTYQEQTLTFDNNYDFTSITWLFIDIDNDLDKDLVIVNDSENNQELAYLLNQNGSTMFGGYTVLDQLSSPDVQLHKHDIDQDTDQDLVVLTDTELAWYRNNAIQQNTTEPEENVPPTVAQPLEDQQSTQDSTFSLTIPTTAFQDANEGDSLTLTVTLANGAALPGWLTFDASTNTLSGTPPEAGELTIRVTATDTSAASVSDEFVLTVNTGKTVTSLDNDLTDGIHLYPIPASQTLFLESKAAGERLVAYRLMDIQGKSIRQQSLLNQRITPISVSSLPKGVYLLEIQTSKRRLHRRLLLE